MRVRNILTIIDIDEPIAEAGVSAASSGDITSLMEMGFSRAQAEKALKETVLSSVYSREIWKEPWIGYSPIQKTPPPHLLGA